jgi:hypothetical protein
MPYHISSAGKNKGVIADKKMTRPFLAGFSEQGHFGLSSAAALSIGVSLGLKSID